MRYIEAPTEYDERDGPRLFLAGGLSDGGNWQLRMASLLADEEVVLLNPRRRSFPEDDPAASTTQIEWEYRHIHRADAMLFWFPCETLCPIALYELGMGVRTVRPLFVGAHPAYRLRGDLEGRLRLARPEISIATSLEALVVRVQELVGSAHIRKGAAT